MALHGLYSIIVILVFILIIFFVFLWNKIERLSIQEKFKDRGLLEYKNTLKEVCITKNKNYLHSIELWEKIASILKINPKLLRFEDKICFLLNPPKGWEFDSSLIELKDFMTNSLSKLGSDKSCYDFDTLGEFVLHITDNTNEVSKNV